MPRLAYRSFGERAWRAAVDYGSADVRTADERREHAAALCRVLCAEPRGLPSTGERRGLRDLLVY